MKLIFVQHDGTETEVEANSGESVMQVALAHGITGITAECNGAAACATCHVIMEDVVLPSLPKMEEHENDMLDFAATERQSGSRLSCQVTVNDALNGQKVRIPEAQ